MNLATAIKNIRKDLGLSQTEFGRRTGIKQANLSLIESGEHTAKMNTLNKIAKGMNIPVPEIYLYAQEDHETIKETKQYKELKAAIIKFAKYLKTKK